MPVLLLMCSKQKFWKTFKKVMSYKKTGNNKYLNSTSELNNNIFKVINHLLFLPLFTPLLYTSITLYRKLRFAAMPHVEILNAIKQIIHNTLWLSIKLLCRVYT